MSSQELVWSKEDPIGDNKRLQMIASGLWPLQQRGKLTIDLTTKRAQLVAMDLAVSQKIPLDNAIQQVQQGTSKMKLKWSRMLKEYDKWFHNPVTMARTVLMVNTKDKSVRVKPCFNNDLHNKLERMINIEPVKAIMLVRGTRHLSNEEKVELFKSQWKRASKIEMGKKAKSLPANMIAEIWDEAMKDLEMKEVMQGRLQLIFQQLILCSRL